MHYYNFVFLNGLLPKFNVIFAILFEELVITWHFILTYITISITWTRIFRQIWSQMVFIEIFWKLDEYRSGSTYKIEISSLVDINKWIIIKLIYQQSCFNKMSGWIIRLYFYYFSRISISWAEYFKYQLDQFDNLPNGLIIQFRWIV